MAPTLSGVSLSERRPSVQAALAAGKAERRSGLSRKCWKERARAQLLHIQRQ